MTQQSYDYRVILSRVVPAVNFFRELFTLIPEQITLRYS